MAAACTKKNPDACCVDETDCAAIGLPVGSTCDDGLLCRGNRCVEVSCSVSAECDLLAPYCVAEATCQPSCTSDAECPGFGQSVAEQFCDTGACVACRAGLNDCSAATPVCDVGACRGCREHSECASGVCTSDGSCALASNIAYAAPFGAAASGCTRMDPCTLTRALELGIGRPYVLLATGSYSNNAALRVNGRTHIVGGSPRPTITRNGAGQIFTLEFGAEATFDNVEINAATSVTNLPGYGVECAIPNGIVRAVRSVFTNNDASGIRATSCTVEVRDSTFTNNRDGISVTDSKVTVERSVFKGQTNKGLNLDGGLFTITNNFLFRNVVGADLFPNGLGTLFEFNTIVDNTSIGVSCQVINNQGTALQMPNNLIARNGMNAPTSPDCVFSSSMIVGSDIAPLKFKSPDSAPFDYHLTAGSSAVDQIGSSTQTRDFDGQPRPAGAGHDYGADELH